MVSRINRIRILILFKIMNGSSVPQTEAMLVPQQARSRRTLEAIVTATVELMDRGDFESASVGQIVSLAGSSVGAFYARFRSKDALFQHISARFSLAADRELSDLMELNPDELTLDQLAHEAIEAVASLYTQHRGFLKNLFTKARLHASEPYLQNSREFNQRVATRFEEYFSRHPEFRETDKASDRLALAFTMVSATLRELIVFGDQALSRGPSGDSLVNEMTRAFCLYLRATP